MFFWRSYWHGVVPEMTPYGDERYQCRSRSECRHGPKDGLRNFGFRDYDPFAGGNVGTHWAKGDWSVIDQWMI
jgi:hypothetical protein